MVAFLDVLLDILYDLWTRKGLGPTTTRLSSGNDAGYTLFNGNGLPQVRLAKRNYCQAWNE